MKEIKIRIEKEINHLLNLMEQNKNVDELRALALTVETLANTLKHNLD